MECVANKNWDLQIHNSLVKSLDKTCREGDNPTVSPRGGVITGGGVPVITDLGRINLAKFLPLYNICQSLVQQGELVKTERMCVMLPDLRNVSEKTIFINLAND